MIKAANLYEMHPLELVRTGNLVELYSFVARNLYKAYGVTCEQQDEVFPFRFKQFPTME